MSHSSVGQREWAHHSSTPKKLTRMCCRTIKVEQVVPGLDTLYRHDGVMIRPVIKSLTGACPGSTCLNRTPTRQTRSARFDLYYLIGPAMATPSTEK